jgi:hypothetical protein
MYSLRIYTTILSQSLGWPEWQPCSTTQSNIFPPLIGSPSNVMIHFDCLTDSGRPPFGLFDGFRHVRLAAILADPGIRPGGLFASSVLSSRAISLLTRKVEPFTLVSGHMDHIMACHGFWTVGNLLAMLGECAIAASFSILYLRTAASTECSWVHHLKGVSSMAGEEAKTSPNADSSGELSLDWGGTGEPS